MKVSPTVSLSFCLVAILFVAACSSVCPAGQKVPIGRKLPAHQLFSMDQIDHGVWDDLLNRYVDDDGNVAYALWKQSAPDMQALDSTWPPVVG